MSLISDAGTPLLSDPGKYLLNELPQKWNKRCAYSGASSIITSMSVSGSDDKFLFYGFLPKTENELEKVLSSLSKNKFSQIFFIPALKINFYIKRFKKYYHNRRVMIAKEITKIHEAFYRDKIETIENFDSILAVKLLLLFQN